MEGVGPSEGRHKEKRSRRETIDVNIEPNSVSFPSKISLWKNPDAFASVFPQLVLEANRPVYEKLGEVGILERTAQVTLQVRVLSEVFILVEYYSSVTNFHIVFRVMLL